ncbi:MAG: calcium-binding protein [Microcoleus anatoxicus]|uniref:calcium-binding protein n=1 Tax=Microcoleus anatoxicus TaxID=2705319 RepID=UPI00366C0179
MVGPSPDGSLYLLNNTPGYFQITPGLLVNHSGGLLAFEGSDTVIGSTDADRVNGNQGSDILFGDEGDDSIRGGKEDDLILGNAGNDLLFGDTGNDLLIGGQVNYLLTGINDNDTLVGNLGQDTLTGGAGDDLFVLREDVGVTAVTADLITDFGNGLDRIGLTGGLTEAQIALESFEGATLIKNQTSGGILGRVAGVSATQLNGRFVSADALFNNNFSGTRDLGILNQTQTFSDSVGNSKPANIYRFSVNAPSTYFQLGLNEMTANADVVLFQDRNSNGMIDGDEIIAFSEAEGSNPERIDILLNSGTYLLVVGQFKGDTNYKLNLSALPLGDFSSKAQISLSGVSETTVNPVNSSIKFNVSDGSFSTNPVNFLVFKNQELIPQSALEISENSISIPSGLTEGRNDIDIYVKDNQSLRLLTDATLWAGSRTLNVTIRDKNGQPVSDTIVKAKLGDNQDVLAEAKTSGDGRVSFPNLPNRTIVLDALGSEGRFASAAATGNAGAVVLTLKGFDAPSLINNNDLSLGKDGWNIGNAPVSLLQNEKPVGSVQQRSQALMITPGLQSSNLNASSFETNQRNIEVTPKEQASIVSSLNRTTSQTSDTNSEQDIKEDSSTGIDLVLGTSGQGEKSISRTFTTKPGTENVTLRYRFITSEVPGGYFGSQYNDYYSVSLRSLKGGGLETDGNTMNGLGRAAFDANGATEFREVTLPVSKDGDTIQVDIGVANVADGILDSQVVVDEIREEDKTDYEDVEIRFKTFIPSEAVSLVPEILTKIPLGVPGLLLYLSPIFNGNDRSFSYDGTYKSFQQVVVTADPKKEPIVRKDKPDFGETKGYLPFQGSQVPGKPFWWWQLNPEEKDKPLLGEKKLEPTEENNNISVERLPSDTVKTTLKVSGGIALFPQGFAPKISANMEVFVRQKEGKKPEFRINARHDGFPAYELYVNRQLAYSYDPLKAGKSPFDLFPPKDQKSNISWQNVPISA